MKHEIANFLRKYHLTENKLYRGLSIINNFFFHRELKIKKMSFGSCNPDKTFYVIRRNNMEEGLLSIFFSVGKEIEYAVENGYIPFIDLQNYKTQYLCIDCIRETRNAWEYYFKQPFNDVEINQIYHSKTVILGGRNLKSYIKNGFSDILEKYDYYDKEATNKLYCWIKKYMDVQEYIYDAVEQLWSEKFAGKNVIGVFSRGTDYIAFSPKGHPIQPDKKVVKEEIDKLKEKHKDSFVFVVTEDEEIYSYISSFFQEDLVEIDDIRLSNYKGDDYIAKYFKNNSYKVGYIYLIKLLLLSKCSFLIASMTNGSKFANIMNNNHYEERIILNLGVYK